MSAFSAATDVIFNNPDMSSAATYRHALSASNRACRVIIQAPEVLLAYGDRQVQSAQAAIRVRVSEIAQADIGDEIEVGTKTFRVTTTPLKDARGLVWSMEALPC